MLRALVLSACCACLATPARAQWLPTSGPPNAQVNFLYSDGDLLFASTQQPFGLFRSADTGRTWKAIAFVQKATNSGRPYATAFGMARLGKYLLATGSEGLQRSDDGGLTWTRIQGPGTQDMVRLSAGHGVVYGSEPDSAYLSLDSGRTWTAMAVPDTMPNSSFGALAANDSEVVIGTSRTTLLRSIDSGRTWTASGRLRESGALHNIAWAQGSCFVGDGNGRVHRSGDGGKTWQNVPVQLTSRAINALAANATHVYAATDDGLVRSSDTGRTWAAYGDQTLYSLDTRYRALVFHRGILIAGGSGGAFRFPGNPGQINFGLGGSPIAAVGASGSRIYAGYDMFGYRGGFGGVYWKRQQSYAYMVPRAYLPFAGKVLAASEGRESGSGIAWLTDHDVNGSVDISGAKVFRGNAYALARLDSTLFAGADSGVYRSTDTARTWKSLGNGMDDVPVRALIAAQGHVFAANRHGFHRSADLGETWQFTGPLKAPVIALAHSGNALWAACDSGREMLRSEDLGETWSPAGAFPGKVSSLAALPGAVIAGTDFGVVRSLDAGKTWHPFMEGFRILDERGHPATDAQVTSLAVGTEHLVMGTARGTVWIRPIADLSLGVVQGKAAERILSARPSDRIYGNRVYRLGPRAVLANGRKVGRDPR